MADAEVFPESLLPNRGFAMLVFYFHHPIGSMVGFLAHQGRTVSSRASISAAHCAVCDCRHTAQCAALIDALQ